MTKIWIPPGVTSVRVRSKKEKLPGKLKILDRNREVIFDCIISSNEPFALPNDAFFIETDLTVEFLPLGAR